MKPSTFSARRRKTLATALIMPLASAVASLAHAQAQPVVEVWKSPTCGCCNDWIKHLEQAGFTVRANDSGNTAVRNKLGMPNRYASCHTALVAGYVVEGHVPAADIRRLLADKPKALGLAVPDMPIGSPGMDGPAYGNRIEPYDVLLIGTDGKSTVFNSHGKAKQK